MKRKVMQVADSTYLISLPINWVKEYSIHKGDELEVKVNGRQIVVTNDNAVHTEQREIQLKDFSVMIERTIHALYKKGVDLITITVEDPSDIEKIQESIGKETVGYEIVSQSATTCTVRSVAASIGEFDSLLKRAFLVQQSMCTDSLAAIQAGEYERLQHLKYLEETNNRLTTLCRRALNRQEVEVSRAGPLYYIIEDLENLADEYKYMFDYILEKQPSLSDELLSIYADTNRMMEDFYYMFYKFDAKLVEKLGSSRKQLVDRIREQMEQCASREECRVLHHLNVIVQKIFCMVGPTLVITV